MKVPISGKVKPENKERVEKVASCIERSLSDTLDRILDDYFSIKEKNSEQVA